MAPPSTDWMAQERERGITDSRRLLSSTSWKDQPESTSIDTPGHVDFRSKWSAPMRVLDWGVWLPVFCAVGGVPAPVGNGLAGQADRLTKCRASGVRSQDGPHRRNFLKVLRQIKDRLRPKAAQSSFPIGAEGRTSRESSIWCVRRRSIYIQ